MVVMSTNELQYLHVCGTCYALYEAGRPDGMNQRCRCGPHGEARWPGFDFNERACLCACCGTEVLPSGSRFSQYFCRECQLLAMGVSLWERRLVFPIGRHSLMNNFVPASRAPSLAAHGGRARDLAETVLAAVIRIGKGSDGLRQWSAIIVSRQLERLALPGGTPLVEYLDAVTEKGTGTTRWAVFAELCEFFVRPITLVRG